MSQAILTKFLGPTNTKGSRVKAWAFGGSITVNYDHALDAGANHVDAALALRRKLGWSEQRSMKCAALPNGNGFVFITA